MLKKSFTFGLLATSLMIIPTAAFADQVTGSNTIVNQTSISSGGGNVTGQSVSAKTIQRQIQNGIPFCSSSGNQVAASNTVAGQGSATAGINNVTGQAGSVTTIQSQISNCSYPYFHY